MPPEADATPDAPQPAVEAPSPAVEVPMETPPAEPAPVAVEAASAPETAQPSTQTAQIPPNEPLPAEPEPIQPPQTAAPVQTGILHSARDLLNKARVAIQDRKRKKRDKIMLALTTKNKITNDEVEKLLHVSDATATRYLSTLEKEGRIRQVGKTGHGVVYQKI